MTGGGGYVDGDKNIAVASAEEMAEVAGWLATRTFADAFAVLPDAKEREKRGEESRGASNLMQLPALYGVVWQRGVDAQRLVSTLVGRMRR